MNTVEHVQGVSAAHGNSAIETAGLTKRYNRLLAVDSLSLTVDRGEIFGFLGPNGAGKSTTMRMLLGLVRPTAGSAFILGMDTSRQIGAILQRTGAIIENPTFYPYLNGRDNLRVVARLAGVGNEPVERVLKTVDLADHATRRYKTYSLGMKQRLAVASTLLSDPDLLILDEPANGLDPAGIVEMRNLMLNLKHEGKTVFVSSHVLHEIEQICDRIAILNHGRVIVQGHVESLLKGGNQVDISVDDGKSERAYQILKALPWVEDVVSEGKRLVVSAPGSRSAELNRALAGAGVYAAEIKLREATLEQYFLGVTNEPSQAAETKPPAATAGPA